MKSINQLIIEPKNIPLLDAEILLSFVIKKTKEFLYTRPEYKLTALQIKKFEDLVSRRIKGEPVAYLTNHKEFYGLDFYVDKNVLIPRPETETLIEEIIKNGKNKKLVIVDIGTGSGCIAITLAKLLPEAKIYATDICKKTLKVAVKNAKNNQVKIGFLKGDLFQPLKDKSIDIVVTNLPYGWEQWEDNTSNETLGLKFEPRKALFAKENGLFLYRQLFRQIAKRRQKPKLIYGEFDPRQKNNLQKLIKEYLPEYQSKIKKDLAGRDRVFVASLKK